MPPANDTFAAPAVLSGLSGAVVFSNVGATLETGEPHSDADGHTVWFVFTTGTNHDWGWEVVLDTTATPLPDWDSVIDVYVGTSLATLTLIAHDDDDGLQSGATDPSGFGTSRAAFHAADSRTYYVRVDSYDTYGTRPDAVLTWSLTATASPYGPGTAPGPWLTYSTDEATSWLSANVLDPDGVEWVTDPSVGFCRDAVTYLDGGGTEHPGPFGFDPTGSPTFYTKTFQTRDISIKLDPADIGFYLLFDHDYTAEIPAGWTGDVEFELPDGTLTTNIAAAVGAIRDDIPVEVYIQPGTRVEVADPASTPYSDSEFSTIRASKTLKLTEPGGSGAFTTVTSWPLPTSWTLIAGPAPPATPADFTITWPDTAVTFGLTFADENPGDSLPWSGHFASGGGQWGLQAADGGVVSYLTSGRPRDLGTSTAPSITDDVVAWRVHWKPPRYRFIIKPGAPPLRQRQNASGIGALAGPALRQRGTLGPDRPTLRQRQEW